MPHVQGRLPSTLSTRTMMSMVIMILMVVVIMLIMTTTTVMLRRMMMVVMVTTHPGQEIAHVQGRLLLPLNSLYS